MAAWPHRPFQGCLNFPAPPSEILGFPRAPREILGIRFPRALPRAPPPGWTGQIGPIGQTVAAAARALQAPSGRVRARPVSSGTLPRGS